MTKEAQAQPKPTAKTAKGTTNAAAQSDTHAVKEGGNVTSIKLAEASEGQNNRPNIFANATAKDQARLNEKAMLMSAAKQKLAMAFDLYRDGTHKGDEAKDAADKAAVTLYSGVAAGLASKDEVSSILGDVFGYKVKGKPQAGAPTITAGVPSDYSKDGVTASKTPFGEGEAIRKRVIRAVQADDYVNGGEATAFFAGLDEKEVNAILARVRTGDLSIWSAYDAWAKLRPPAKRVELAFDAKRISGMFEKLAEDGGKPAVSIFQRSPELVAAYAALMDTLTIIGEMAAMSEAKAA